MIESTYKYHTYISNNLCIYYYLEVYINDLSGISDYTLRHVATSNIQFKMVFNYRDSIYLDTELI